MSGNDISCNEGAHITALLWLETCGKEMPRGVLEAAFASWRKAMQRMKKFIFFTVLFCPAAIGAQSFSFWNVSQSRWPVVNAAMALDSTDNLVIFWQDSTGAGWYRFRSSGTWSEPLSLFPPMQPVAELAAATVADTSYVAWIEGDGPSRAAYRKVAAQTVSPTFELYSSSGTIARLKWARRGDNLTFAWLEQTVHDSQIRLADMLRDSLEVVVISLPAILSDFGLDYDDRGALWLFWVQNGLYSRVREPSGKWSGEMALAPLPNTGNGVSEISARFNARLRRYEMGFATAIPPCDCPNALLAIAGNDTLWTAIEIVVPERSSAAGDYSRVSRAHMAVDGAGNPALFGQYRYVFPGNPAASVNRPVLATRGENSWSVNDSLFAEGALLLDAATSGQDSLYCLFLQNGDVYLAREDRVSAVKQTLAPAVPVQFTLEQNFPNPFNPSTRIRFFLQQPAHVRLEIFTLSGKRIRVLEDQSFAAGEHNVQWDGKDEHGRPVAGGIYFYRIVVGKASATRRMILLR